MKQITGEKNSSHSLEEVGQFGSTVGEQPASARRSKGSGETPSNDPAPVEGVGSESLEQPATPSSPVVPVGETSGDVEQARSVSPPALRRAKGKDLNVREVEMARRMEELSDIEEISVGGSTNIEAEVIGSIAGVAAQSVKGVASLGTTSLRRTIRERMGSSGRRARGVEVEVGSREAILDISIRVIYGHSIPLTVMRVREIVADRLLKLCGLLAKEINIKVTGIEFPDKPQGRIQQGHYSRF